MLESGCSETRVTRHIQAPRGRRRSPAPAPCREAGPGAPAPSQSPLWLCHDSAAQLNGLFSTRLFNSQEKHICLYLRANSCECAIFIDIVFFPSKQNKYNLKSNIRGRKIWLLDETGSFIGAIISLCVKPAGYYSSGRDRRPWSSLLLLGLRKAVRTPAAPQGALRSGPQAQPSGSLFLPMVSPGARRHLPGLQRACPCPLAILAPSAPRRAQDQFAGHAPPVRAAGLTPGSVSEATDGRASPT